MKDNILTAICAFPAICAMHAADVRYCRFQTSSGNGTDREQAWILVGIGNK